MTAPENPTILDAFEQSVRTNARKTALIYLGATYTYERLGHYVRRFAGGLQDLGVRQGHKVILYAPNSIQWVVAWLGILRAGAVAVPITPIYTPYDLDYIANDTGAFAIVCTDRNFGYVKQIKPDSNIEQIVITRVVDLLPWYKKAVGWLFDRAPSGNVVSGRDTHSFLNIVKKGGSGASLPDVKPEDTAEILYTGGTTKYPKGVPITHDAFMQASLEQLAVCEGLFKKEDNVIMCAAPLFHILGQACGLGTLLVGGTLIVAPKVNIDGILDAIQRSGAKTFIGVPALYRMILEHDRLDQYDLTSLEYCFSAGDVLPAEVGKRWRSTLDRQVYQGYGATETVGGVAMCPTGVENPSGAMGLPLPSKKILIVDAVSLDRVTPGDPGELLVSSDKMVSSYWNKPEETQSSFVRIGERNWYRTGDIVRQDENGYLYFVDRTVDTIKHKGYRVSASEIEAVLQEHPAVISSCVVGIPDEKLGERIKAFVVLKKDIKGITGYDLMKWTRQRLPSYKVPQYIEFRDMLPKSKVGKLLRREIRSEEQKRLTV
ncbi:MAG: AMP-binding protein [Deltaproteobacteria bacterium]|nr:AMP-binding protein [Deltaproteobacteria bacterium]